MTTIARRFESLAERSSALMEQQGAVFHRFIARIQGVSDQIDSISFEELADRLEQAVETEEQRAKEEAR